VSEVPSDIARFGYRCGVAAAIATVAFVASQVGQLVGVLRYPLDEVLIYGTSLCIVVPFLLEMLALHHLTESTKRFWTHGALMFTLIYAVFVVANYVVQLATVIPAKLNETETDIAILDQTPHSLFWNFDAIGYISMGFAAMMAIPALRDNGPERFAKWSCLAHALITPLIALVYFYPTFSETLLLFGAPWAVTAPLFMFSVALILRGQNAS
jgi:hypothetical protein